MQYCDCGTFKGDSFYSIGRKTRKQLGVNFKQGDAAGAGVASRASHRWNKLFFMGKSIGEGQAKVFGHTYNE